ncbi:EF-hand domain-containing protein [Mesorhizobium sp. ES1-4]|uniref:EF-hand domain-containing protein n=1 Tax=Mesorhizobium sp. ES1-4 TaxID=2876627 RepID=UPI001CCB90F4|nr:EF-hand domain-containing protein [Mesorhizobium sp. ES1-4]MBZ9798400.1 EF-hand domain-containing protein [Mesorhizobium sp. ES1-4]
MRFPRCTTTAAAAFIFATFPALAQTNGTPAPTPATQQPGAGQLPDVNGQAGGPTHEMIRQMIEQAVQERMQQDRSSNEGNNPQEEGDNRQAEASRHGDGWQRHRNGGPAGEHAMVRNHGPRMMRGTGMRLMLALLDADGDGSLSENEVQEAVGRIFSAIDQNGDGKIDMDEIQSFSHGSGGGEEMP